MDLNVGQQVAARIGQSVARHGSAATGSTGHEYDERREHRRTAQIVVVGTDSYIVNTTVDDTEIGQIADGDQADIVPTGSTTTDYGTVASVSLIGSQSSNVTTFPVVIDVTGTRAGSTPGRRLTSASL